MSILLADDDIHLASFLSKSLELEGYSVHTALDEDSVLSELRRQNYKLIILDLNLGETDGLKLLEKLRAGGLKTPILVLSARNRISDRIQSLNLGADDYITKPFSFQELAARAKALLRRKVDPSLHVLRVEDLVLDPASRKAQRGKREIRLSPKEFELLFLLMRHAGETVSRQDLLRDSWGLELESDSNLVDVYVNYLRKKIDSRDEEKLIHTVRGSGYRIGRPAPVQSSDSFDAEHSSDVIEEPGKPYSGSPDEIQNVVEQQPLRALINSLVHDLSQPLTSVRCFLELTSLQEGAGAAPAADLRNTEQQADRAIALTKAISVLVRETPAPADAWISLDALLNEIVSDFNGLLHSGLLSLDRQRGASIVVSSSPVLRHLLVLLLSKLVGRNADPVVLTVAAQVKEDRCELELKWKTAETSQKGIADARSIFLKDLPHLQALTAPLGAEISLMSQPEIVLSLPAGPQKMSGAA
jgi:DNA-binding response OmpR family regulator